MELRLDDPAGNAIALLGGVAGTLYFGGQAAEEILLDARGRTIAATFVSERQAGRAGMRCRYRYATDAGPRTAEFACPSGLGLSVDYLPAAPALVRPHGSALLPLDLVVAPITLTIAFLAARQIARSGKARA